MRKNILILTAVFIFTLSAIACFSTRESDIAANSKPKTANTETNKKQSGQADLEKSPETEKPAQDETPEKRKNEKEDSPDVV